MSSAPPFDRAVVDQAIDWLVLLKSGSVDEVSHRAWMRWRTSHAEHERVWRHIETMNRRIERGAGELTTATALAALDAPTSATRRRALKMLSVTLVAGAAGALYGVPPWTQWAADISTARGERRDFRLADGTWLQLNTQSAANIRFDTRRRAIHLIQGEILVNTSQDSQQPARPFEIETTAGSIHPIGTRFVVRQDGAIVRVGVIDGAVQLRPADAQIMIQLDKGQATTFTSQGVGTPQPIESEAAWAEGVLVASDMRLADFIAELRRYRAGYLSCDAAVGDLRISGVFPVDDPERVLRSLPAVLPVRLQSFGRYWIRIVATQN